MLLTATGFPTIVAIDFDHVALDPLVETLSAVVKIDHKIVAAARTAQPHLQLWDFVDVGNLIDQSGDLEMMAVVYSPVVVGKNLTIRSPEVTLAVLDHMNTYHMKKYRSPLNWNFVEEYQMGFEDYEAIDDLRDAFDRWDAQRQKALIASALPETHLSKKKQKI